LRRKKPGSALSADLEIKRSRENSENVRRQGDGLPRLPNAIQKIMLGRILRELTGDEKNCLATRTHLRVKNVFEILINENVHCMVKRSLLFNVPRSQMAARRSSTTSYTYHVV
jgi:hypothetical protein